MRGTAGQLSDIELSNLSLRQLSPSLLEFAGLTLTI